MYTVSERDMLMSIIAVLEDDNKTDLSAILQSIHSAIFTSYPIYL